jgi:hypothetical protein
MRVQGVNKFKTIRAIKPGVFETILRKRSLTFWILSTLPGWLLVSITESDLVANLSACWGVLVTVGWIWSCIGHPLEMIRFVRLGALSLCAIQNFSWLISSLILQFSLGSSLETALSQSMGGGISVSYYALAILYVGAFAAFLVFVGSGRKIFSLEQRLCAVLQQFSRTPIARLELVLIVLVTIELALIVTGVIGQRSLIVEGYDEGKQPFWRIFYEVTTSGQIILNVILFFLIRQRGAFMKSKRASLVFLFSFIILLFICFNKGRSALIFVVGAHVYWLFFYTAKRPAFFKIILIIAIIYPLLSQLLLFNNFIRSSASGIKEWRGSAIEVVPLAWERFQESSDLRSAEKEKTTSNLSTRTLVASPLALCLQLPNEKKTFMYGENLINSVIWSIPGPLFPDKKDFPVQEELLYAHFPIGDKDTADSLYLSAYTEFGWMGIIIYPMLVAGLWLLVLSLSSFFQLSGVILIINVAMFFQLYFLGIGEAAANNWFLSLRTFLGFLAINSVIRIFFARQSFGVGNLWSFSSSTFNTKTV